MAGAFAPRRFVTGKTILQKRIKRDIIGNMGKHENVECFEEVETSRAYNGYFCSIPEAISIVVLGSICGLRNISQTHQWAETMLPEDRGGLIVSLDGKTVHSTSKMESYDSPLHIISSQISELGITFPWIHRGFTKKVLDKTGLSW